MDSISLLEITVFNSVSSLAPSLFLTLWLLTNSEEILFILTLVRNLLVTNSTIWLLRKHLLLRTLDVWFLTTPALTLELSCLSLWFTPKLKINKRDFREYSITGRNSLEVLTLPLDTMKTLIYLKVEVPIETGASLTWCVKVSPGLLSLTTKELKMLPTLLNFTSRFVLSFPLTKLCLSWELLSLTVVLTLFLELEFALLMTSDVLFPSCSLVECMIILDSGLSKLVFLPSLELVVAFSWLFPTLLEFLFGLLDLIPLETQLEESMSPKNWLKEFSSITLKFSVDYLTQKWTLLLDTTKIR